ncbi:DUF4910 domain-containing protein [Pseudothermotoga lettingae]|jgi:hypothetical protein|uniref:Peptidase M28 n=1 Tax=Pseudothermotoga lettingae (strain ATCC BAA-301 / DSM 14385 / NBRC 107922 / TMO) TaxID=416591 RepID=A8F5K7_PSELT|nr:DUF4910 domain-containing protein [Pseudothermotoga lettingae]ABV33441.1 peptidase M28 [Pseudothermotoga lettingae TMO]GLI49645.1 hypothetical protein PLETTINGATMO_18140 [Pseudothermotoga lettingae TMO]
MLNEQETFEIMRFISSYHRVRGSREYRSLLAKIKEMLLNWGIPEKSIQVIEYASGDVKYGNFETTMVWEIQNGELWIDTPRTFINSFKACKTSVLFGSNPTNGWQVLEIVDENYKGDFSSRAVVTDQNPNMAFKKYVKELGAKCLLVYFMRAQDESIGRAPEKMPDTINYLSLPHTFETSQYGAFGFSLTYNQYKLLRELANKNFKVRLMIDSHLEKGFVHVMRISFSPERFPKIAVVAHLCHPSPGANDNASGAALALHLCNLLAQNRVNAGVDILLLPEFYGTLPYVAENKYDFVINLDMIGEAQDKTGSALIFHETIPLLNTYFDELLYQSLLSCEPNKIGLLRKKFFRSPFKSGSDHVVFQSYGIPAPFIGQWPDRYYHTNEDTPDKCDPAMFKWIAEAVFRTISLAHDIPKDITEITKGRVKGFLTKIKKTPGSDAIISAVKKAHGLKAKPAPSKIRLKTSNNGPLGYEWLGKAEGVPDKEYIVDLAEVLNMAVRFTGDFDASVSFTSTYLSVDPEEVIEILNLLIKEGLIYKQPESKITGNEDRLEAIE